MRSKVHPKYKIHYRVANWSTYNHALVRRGDVTVWLAPEAIAAWTPCRSGIRSPTTLGGIVNLFATEKGRVADHGERTVSLS